MKIDLSDISKQLCACISFPRLMPTEICLNMASAARQLGLRIIDRPGLFYGKSLTFALKGAIGAGAEYALTIDYDTPHQRDDIIRLYGIMKLNPEIDAVCSLQMRRDSKQTLISFRDPETGQIAETFNGAAFTGNTVKVAAGNFGLTIIRLSSLAKLPKPWFIAVPDEDGEWGENSIDEDVNFWRGWERAGLTLHCAHVIPVAHMEMGLTWPGLDFRPVYQSMEDFRKNGMPASVRRIE